MQKWIIICVVVVIILLSFFIVFNIDIETEYVPQEEISEYDSRKTMINLYYKNKNTNELVLETKLIDSKNLLKNPYLTIVELLIDKPENEELESVINDKTLLKDVSFNKNIVTVKFEKNILVNGQIDENIIKAITNSLKQLNEVEDVIIQVEGNENNNVNITNNVTNIESNI